MDEHERIGPTDIFRGEHLDVDLTLHDVLAGLAGVFPADVEMPALGDRRLVYRRHRQLGWLRPARRRGGEYHCRRQ